MELMNQKKYVFIKAYQTLEGTIPEGSELIYFRERYFLNGGMLHPAYHSKMEAIVTNPTLKNQYLREVGIIHNKV